MLVFSSQFLHYYFFFKNDSKILNIQNALLLFCLIAAFPFHHIFQKYLDPVRAAILYALEPVWATLLAITFDMTEFSFWLILGGSSLLVGNLVAELGNQSVSE